MCILLRVMPVKVKPLPSEGQAGSFWSGLHPEMGGSHPGIRAASPCFWKKKLGTWDSRKKNRENAWNWDDTRYCLPTVLKTSENKINIYLPKDGSRFKKTGRQRINGDTTTGCRVSRGKCLRPVSSSGDRDRNTSWWGWPWTTWCKMDLSDYIAKKHISRYGSFLMIFFTYVGLIQGLPQ